jgi:hypothetical protein
MQAWSDFLAAFGAAILLAAALAKLGTRGRTAPFLVAVGVPPRLATFAARIVIPLEVLLGVGLLVPTTRRVFGWPAVALAVGFAVLQWRALRVRGVPNCGCLGALDGDVDSSAISFARSAGLLAAVLASSMFGTLGGAPENTAISSAMIGGGALSGISFLVALAIVSRVVRFERERPRYVAGAVFFGRR